MLLLVMLISLSLNLKNNQDTIKVGQKAKQVQRTIKFQNASDLTIEKLDSLLIQFNKIDSLTNK